LSFRFFVLDTHVAVVVAVYEFLSRLSLFSFFFSHMGKSAECDGFWLVGWFFQWLIKTLAIATAIAIIGHEPSSQWLLPCISHWALYFLWNIKCNREGGPFLAVTLSLALGIVAIAKYVVMK